MTFEPVGDVPPNDPGNYWNTGPGRIPQHHTRVIDYCKLLGVELQPFIYYDAANLMQNDAWNDGKPVQLRRLRNDLRGHLSELLAKVHDQGALDQLIEPADSEAFLAMLAQFGQLTIEDANIVYETAALKSTFPRTGFRVEPGDVATTGSPFPELSLDDIVKSEFWQKGMFDSLRYFWQATLMQPVDGMDMIVKGFHRADIPGGRTIGDLILYDQPVRTIDLQDGKVSVITSRGPRPPADYVVATASPGLIAGFGGNLLGDRDRHILSSIYVGPACKVGLQGRSRFWEEEDRIYGGISFKRGLIVQIWYPSAGFNSATGVLTAAYNIGPPAATFQQLSRAERIETALREGEKLHPGYRDKVFAENAASIAWAKMPYQTGAFAFETAFEQPEVFRQMAGLASIGDRVFPAGDWFSRWPGWQEGALDSAHYATDRILEFAKQAN
ncbi:MAG: hypothetical protein GY798_00870, partial [Hyphomicrobiales bacterium]|nr:hypothetical protein [Hyphomicrobiales bacterium]